MAGQPCEIDPPVSASAASTLSLYADIFASKARGTQFVRTGVEEPIDDERTVDEQTGNERTVDEQTGDESTVDDRVPGDRKLDDRRHRGTDATETVRWRRLPADEVDPPLVTTLPYLELKLEHPALEPTGQSAQFVPDAVPYEFDDGDEHRVFFWRSALGDGTIGAPDRWRLACATIRGLWGIENLPATTPELTGESDGRSVLDVDGTIAGGARVASVEAYEPPALSIEDASQTAVTLQAGRDEIDVSAGSRRRLELESQTVPQNDGEARATIPMLTVRYPGQRTIYHPGPDSGYQLFPGFGLDLDGVPRSLGVPTSAGELDSDALATTLDVDLAARPYPERVLWQAFAYAAFEPHADDSTELLQWDEGCIGVFGAGEGSEY